jgi:hypothetical protein
MLLGIPTPSSIDLCFWMCFVLKSIVYLLSFFLYQDTVQQNDAHQYGDQSNFEQYLVI